MSKFLIPPSHAAPQAHRANAPCGRSTCGTLTVDPVQLSKDVRAALLLLQAEELGSGGLPHEGTWCFEAGALIPCANNDRCAVHVTCESCLGERGCGFCVDSGGSCLRADAGRPSPRPAAATGVQCLSPAWIHGFAQQPLCADARCTVKRSREECIAPLQRLAETACGWCTHSQQCLPTTLNLTCEYGWEVPRSPMDWTSARGSASIRS